MDHQGDWPDEVWLDADAIGTDGSADGHAITEIYAPGIACHAPE
jgi:hypothetical protein